MRFKVKHCSSEFTKKDRLLSVYFTKGHERSMYRGWHPSCDRCRLMIAFSKIVSTIALWKLLAGNLSCKEQAKDIGKEIASSDKGSEGKRKRQFDWRGKSRKIATSNTNITIFVASDIHTYERNDDAWHGSVNKTTRGRSFGNVSWRRLFSLV